VTKITIDDVDVTPSWVEMTSVIERLLVDDDFDNRHRELARTELLKMAKIADAYVAMKKDIKTVNCEVTLSD
jgi:hypothetical protein|tara:strand:- start:20 stop:235 length:216 start_codon:yes stop_codon:yes gene_type:complete